MSSTGVESAPQEFKCTIVPRPPRAANLIRTAALDVQESMSVGYKIGIDR